MRCIEIACGLRLNRAVGFIVRYSILFENVAKNHLFSVATVLVVVVAYIYSPRNALRLFLIPSDKETFHGFFQ